MNSTVPMWSSHNGLRTWLLNAPSGNQTVLQSMLHVDVVAVHSTQPSPLLCRCLCMELNANVVFMMY